MKFERDFSPLKVVLESKEDKEFLMSVLYLFSKYNSGPFISMQSSELSKKAKDFYDKLERL